MKKRIHVYATCLLSLILACAFIMPAESFAAGTNKKPKADAVDYYKDPQTGKYTGIKSITISPYTYYNLSRDPELSSSSDPSTLVLDDAMMQKIAQKKIFPRWGVIAEGIFRDQANQLVTIEGSGMMSSDTTSSNSFDRHFSKTRSGVSGHNYDWALDDLASTLGTPPSKDGRSNAEQNEFSILKGKTNNDEVVYSGVYPINNLNEARTLMGKSLRACADDDDLTVDDFLANSKDKSDNKYRLPDLANDKTGDGYCSIVTCVNRAGSSGDYDYVCFGLAAYDFDVTPIVAQDLEYIRAAQDYDNSEDPIKAAAQAHAKGVFYEETPNQTVTTLRNLSAQESTSAVALATEESEEIGSTTEESFEWGMEQEIGTDIGIGSGDAGFPRVLLHFQQNFHELWNTMRGKSTTSTKTENRSVNQELELPGHTVAMIKQSNTKSSGWENYQQPVVLNYKVAVFAMSGDYYNGWGGMISDSRYDKEWMSILFDGSDGCEPGGCNALASLQNRAIVNKDTDGYDRTKGKYTSWCDKSAWRYNTKINWTNIASTLQGDNRGSHTIPNYKGEKSSLQDLASELSFAETTRKFTRERRIMTSSVDAIVPLYNLHSVDITDGSRNYEVRTGDKLYLDGIELGGFDNHDNQSVPFYGFDPAWGKWNLSEADLAGATSVTEDGVKKQTTEDGLVTLHTDEQTGSQWITVSSDPITSDKPYHLIWELDTDAKISSNETFNDKDGHPNGFMLKEELEAVETPSLGISVKSDTANLKSITTSGSYIGPFDQNINLNRELDVTAQNTDGSLMSIPIYWEDNDVRTIDVKENGDTRFSTPGTYKVRAYSMDNGKKIASNWVEITAKEKASLRRIDFSADSLDQDDLTLTSRYQTRSYDLDSFVKYYDQFDETWAGTEDDPLPEIQFAVEDMKGDTVDPKIASVEDGILTVSATGTYKITATAFDRSGNRLSYSIPALKLKITQEDWLNSIEFEEPALGKPELALHNRNDQIRIGNLKGLLSYYDQKGDVWKGTTPRVSFHLTKDTSGAEIKSGEGYTFFAYEPGTYTIQPVVEGFNVNPVTIEVTENPYLVIETRDPAKLPITERGGSVTVDLDKCVVMTTQFGGKYEGDYPAMDYSLDEGVEGASIGEATVGEDGDKTTIENAFTSDTPGKYTVHVTPKKASVYSGVIDDIEINVYKKRHVQYVTMDFSKMDLSKRTVPDGGEGWSLDLSDYIAYYDQFGDPIEESELSGFDIPEVDRFSVTSLETGGEVKKEGDNWLLTVQSAGTYCVTPEPNTESNAIGWPAYLFLIDTETSEDICDALIELLEAYEEVCVEYIDEAASKLQEGFSELIAASTDAEIDSALQRGLGELKKYDHKGDTPVVENVDPQAGTCDEVINCANCGRELSRETISTVQTSIADAEVTIPAVTYTGKAIAPAASIVLGGTTLTAGTDFEITCTNNVNAGTANAIVSGKGKYTGTLTKTFTINKANNPLSVKAKTVKVKRNKLKKKSQTLKTSKMLTFKKKGQGTMQYTIVSVKKGSKSYKKYFKINKTTGKITIKKNKKMKKGVYKVKLSVKAAGNANYNASTVKPVTVRIKVR